MSRSSDRADRGCTFPDHAALIHQLNQRYQREWDRAEALQAELRDIHASRAWRALAILRRCKRWWARRPVAARPSAGFTSERLTDLPEAPPGKVSIVIPFKNRVGLLQSLVHSIRASTYRRFEIVLVDNGSDCPRTQRYVERLRPRRGYRVLACPWPFNFARLCNAGAQQATGDFLLFLNNDMLVLTPRWLEALLSVGTNPRVGVVGAVLLYPNGTIQHAGIFPCGVDAWEHAYRGRPADDPGDAGEMAYVHTVPAVTGACMLIRHGLFREVGGFCEDLPVTGNDVDLCVRVRQRGLLVALTPHARLLHFESLTRGYSVDAPKAGCIHTPLGHP